MVVLLSGLVVQGAGAESGGDTMSTIGWARWVGDEDLMTFDVFELVCLEANSSRSVEYEVSPWTVVPLVYYRLPDGEGGEKDVLNYNFRGAVNFLAGGLSNKLNGGDWTDGDAGAGSAWRYALFAPDFRVRFRLVGNLKLMAGTRTDYFLYRTSDTERGILFTPFIGLDFSGGDYGASEGYGGLSVSVGLRNWLSFDGDNRSGELAVFASLRGLPVTN